MTLADNDIDIGLKCRLISLLGVLPLYNRNYLLGQLAHTELLRLSVCCRLLRDKIRNDNVLWKKIYRCRYLRGVYCKKEWEFVLWCARTDPNNIGLSVRRKDLLNNIDWHSVYRRRVSTENNWQSGRSNDIHIDTAWQQDINLDRESTKLYFVSATSVVLQQFYYDNNIMTYSYYIVESVAHTI
jgi:hypothetical protein